MIRRIPPTIGIPKNIRKPQPIEGPTRSRAAAAIASLARGHATVSSRPIRNEETDAAIQYAIRLTIARFPASKLKVW